DTNSRINTLVGGRLFPGVHHHACFIAAERDQHLAIALTSDDQQVRVYVAGRPAAALPANSVLGSLAEASAFFERGALGYSATRRRTRFDGLELRSQGWRVNPFAVERVESSFFDDPSLFPAGSVTFDCALLMRNLRHEWHGHAQLCSQASPAVH